MSRGQEEEALLWSAQQVQEKLGGKRAKRHKPRKSSSLPLVEGSIYSSQAKHLALFPVSSSQACSLSATCIVSHGSANCRLGSPLDVKVKSAHEAALVVFKLVFFFFFSLTVDHFHSSSSPDHQLVFVGPR